MNVLLLGNGFDLYYKLPTKYSNFLHVANYLSTHLLSEQQSIGDILAQEEIQLADPFIKVCYDAHKTVFDAVSVDTQKLGELTDIVQHNKWFAYLLHSFNKDVGWIDFEKEIAYVVACFSSIIPATGKNISYKNHKYGKFIVDFFDFLVDKTASRNSVNIGANIVSSEFCIEHPLGSRDYHISRENVASYLSKELQGLSRALELYLSCFVDTPMELLRKEKTCKCLSIFNHIEKAITFNYTNTYEAVYRTGNAYHIHGRLGDNLVLGINPDEADNVDTVDTSFIQFKKYFQRTLYETDYDYLKWMSDIKSNQQSYRLIVMGHSLDITDKDIIRDLFHYANEIIILYHSQEAKAAYISNLVALYGKDGFDSLRREQALTFLALDADLSELAQKMNDEANQNLADMFPNPIII